MQPQQQRGRTLQQVQEEWQKRSQQPITQLCPLHYQRLQNFRSPQVGFTSRYSNLKYISFAARIRTATSSTTAAATAHDEWEFVSRLQFQFLLIFFKENSWFISLIITDNIRYALSLQYTTVCQTWSIIASQPSLSLPRRRSLFRRWWIWIFNHYCNNIEYNRLPVIIRI